MLKPTEASANTMKKSRQKVPHLEAGKRNPMQDICTAAGRTAKHREFDMGADQQLRAALNHPTDLNGQPLVGHRLKTIAAERLVTVDSSSSTSVFDSAASLFLGAMKYSCGCAPSISSLWKSFLGLVEAGSPDTAMDFARSYATAFRWCVAGHIHRLADEHQRQPHSIVMVEIWENTGGRYSVGVQNNGERRMMPTDRPPESPMIVFAGTKVPHFIAPQDLQRMRRMGSKQLREELESGKFKFSPRPLALKTEDTLLNVAAPTEIDLGKIRPVIGSLLATIHYRPKRHAKPGA